MFARENMLENFLKTKESLKSLNVTSTNSRVLLLDLVLIIPEGVIQSRIAQIMKMKSIAVSFGCKIFSFFFFFNVDFLCLISVVDCSDNEFKCQDMTCIPKDKVCDNIPDCPFPDNSDEDNCPTTTPRPGS